MATAIGDLSMIRQSPSNNTKAAEAALINT
jgi:hypothetical protein